MKGNVTEENDHKSLGSALDLHLETLTLRRTAILSFQFLDDSIFNYRSYRRNLGSSASSKPFKGGWIGITPINLFRIRREPRIEIPVVHTRGVKGGPWLSQL